MGYGPWPVGKCIFTRIYNTYSWKDNWQNRKDYGSVPNKKMSNKCDRNWEEKHTIPLELGCFARASNGEIQTEKGEGIPVGEITRVSKNTKTRKPHVQKFPRESCKCRISLAGQQIKTFKSVNRDLKEPAVFREWVQESKDFHLLFLSQASISTRAWHTRVFNSCQTGPKSSGHLKAQFSALEEGMLKLTFVHYNLYVRTAEARRVISDFFFFSPFFQADFWLFRDVILLYK